MMDSGGTEYEWYSTKEEYDTLMLVLLNDYHNKGNE